jgi:mono/diheme cytochrome c family protein
MIRGRAPRSRSVIGAVVVLALSPACDDRQALHEPSFSLERMQEQPRVDPFDPGMRAPPAFAIPRGTSERAARPQVTRALVDRGKVRFEAICAACHGLAGDGDSPVADKMLLRRPPSLAEPRLRALSDEQIAAVIAGGYGLMPSYANPLPGDDRWAVVAYVRALQVAQGVQVAWLPGDVVAELTREAP